MFRMIIMMCLGAAMYVLASCKPDDPTTQAPPAGNPVIVDTDDAMSDDAPQGDTSTTFNDVQQDAHNLWNTIKLYTIEQKDRAVAVGRSTVADMGARYAELKAEAAVSGEAAQAKWETLKGELDERMKLAQVEVDGLKKATAEKWDQSKHKLAEAMEAMSEQLDVAAKALNGEAETPAAPDDE